MNSQQAINLLKGLEQSLDDYCELNDEGKAAFRMAIAALELFGISEQLPSAQPPYNLDEWCHDCKEYDQERHCCPRFNRVIKQTKEDFEAQNEIIYCRDCRHHGTAICRIWSRYGTINTPGYGFCYRAERKEQDE